MRSLNVKTMGRFGIGFAATLLLVAALGAISALELKKLTEL